ncbi:MAG: type II toxin-antitoxin system mRNA interferase toxin, RelE/StbE family [bacterium]
MSVSVEIYYHPKFAKEYRKLPKDVRRAAEKKEILFRIDPYHPQLRTHKLQGDLEGFWAFWIKYHYRIVFEFVDSGCVRFYSVGNHDIYD